MKVKLKTAKEFEKLAKAGEIEVIGCSDSGEITHYGTKGNPSHLKSVWFDDYGQEYLVVDHPNPISRESYENRKIFFEKPTRKQKVPKKGTKRK